MDKVIIPLSNDYRLVVEKNTGEFDKEVYVGIENPTGAYIQDLAIVRPTHKSKNDEVIFDCDKFEILVFADETQEDYTNKFTIGLHQEDEE